MIITDFNPKDFMQQFWQRKPCIIRHMFPNFSDPIDEHDLAGLAMEQEVDSRIISHSSNENWHVEIGPFEDFNDVCIDKWTLLVQAVDSYVPQVDQLRSQLSFLASWRLSDVLVSFSVEQAGVGPHIDQYDVFILQGKGSRRWQVGLPGKHQQTLPHKLLKQILPFEPILDEVLRPGDVVYIPPNHPHNGIAIEPCLNYSFGCRAPTDIEMILGLTDEINSLESFEKYESRYQDQNQFELRQSSGQSAEVSNQELMSLKTMLHEYLDKPDTDELLLKLLSRKASVVFESEEYLSYEEFFSLTQNSASLIKYPGIHPIFIRQNIENQTTLLCAVEGNTFRLPIEFENELVAIINQPVYQLTEDFIDDKRWLTFLFELYKFGFWCLENSE